MLTEIGRLLSSPSPQAITIANGAATQATNVLGCRKVRITSDTAGFIAFGANPTATSADHYIPANIPLDLRVNPDDKISVIPKSGLTLSLYISPIG